MGLMLKHIDVGSDDLLTDLDELSALDNIAVHDDQVGGLLGRQFLKVVERVGLKFLQDGVRAGNFGCIVTAHDVG